MDYIQGFADYLKNERKLAVNTRLAYTRDIRQFLEFCAEKGNSPVAQIGQAQVAAYLLLMKNNQTAAATVTRRLAAVRAFSKYLRSIGVWQESPALGFKPPRAERAPIVYLEIAEIEQLLEQPGCSNKGVRDRALLELLYATGMRVSEAAALDLADLNLTIGYVMIEGPRPRIIPLGRPARQAVEAYVETARPQLVKLNPAETACFVNLDGGRLTRQGLWKLIREYGKKLPFADRLTPQILRNSFAVHLVQNGADLKTLKELMGQEDIAATQIYMSITKNRVKEVYDKAFPRA